MVTTVTNICENHRGEIIVAVSHADTIKAFLTAALGTPLDLFQRLHISPCSVSPVILEPKAHLFLLLTQQDPISLV